MKNKNNIFVVVFAVVLAAVAAVILFRERAQAPGNGVVVGTTATGAGTDDITAIPSPEGDDDQVVENKTAGYFFTAPADWYVERSAGTGLAVYPDYDPTSGEAPTCKIEVSAFSGADVSDLDAWVTAHLHADPTASVVEDSRQNIATADGASSTALEWRGTLNGIATTLGYAEGNGPDGGGGEILEFAASSLTEPGTGSNSDVTGSDDCGLMVEPLVANLHFGDYQP
jgi:hypothetical protein